jgi:hypothetical protein
VPPLRLRRPSRLIAAREESNVAGSALTRALGPRILVTICERAGIEVN